MVLGLKQGCVALVDYDSQWALEATQIIEKLWQILGSGAQDIQHVGSTAIMHIKAKPIIDIAVAVDDLSSVEVFRSELENQGFTYRRWDTDEQLLYAVGDYLEPDGLVTHFVHIVETNSVGWNNYIDFRDYLNAKPAVAEAYESIKVKLAADHPYDPGRKKYLAGKHDFIRKTLADAFQWAQRKGD